MKRSDFLKMLGLGIAAVATGSMPATDVASATTFSNRAWGDLTEQDLREALREFEDGDVYVFTHRVSVRFAEWRGVWGVTPP